MRTLIRHSLIVVLCSLCALAASAQVDLVKGLPFEATKTRIINLPENGYTVSGMVARSSNGSTYEEHRNRKTNEIDLITITDAPGRRSIVLDVKRRFYSIQPANLAPLNNGLSREALQKYIQYLKTVKPTRTTDDGVETEMTPLGFRTQDGFLEFGRRQVFENVSSSSSLSSLKQKIWEDWRIPALSLTAENTGFDTENKPVQIIKLSNIRTEEPDPGLFEIPSGYTPWPTCPCK